MKHRHIMLVVTAVFLTACANLLPNENTKNDKENTTSVIAHSDSVVKKEKIQREVNVNECQEELKRQNKPVQNKSDSVPIITKPVPKIIGPETEIQIIGQIEYVDILPEGIRQKARIDTGAETTSIGAFDIEYFERDGKSWVKFKVLQRSSGKTTEFTKRVVRNVRIKRHGAKNIRRPVIKMTLAMGSIKKKIEVSLTNRSKFDFPVLIGRNFLYGDIRVDVSSKFLMLDK